MTQLMVITVNCEEEPMQADSQPIRSGNQDLLYRPLGKIRLWACTCKQEPPLYLRLSTKRANPMESVESSYKRLNSCFVAISSFHTVYYTSRGLTFFLKRVLLPHTCNNPNNTGHV